MTRPSQRNPPGEQRAPQSPFVSDAARLRQSVLQAVRPSTNNKRSGLAETKEEMLLYPTDGSPGAWLVDRQGIRIGDAMR